MQYRHRRGGSEGSHRGTVPVLHAELGPRQCRHPRRKALSRRLRSSAQRPDRPLPLQGRDQNSQGLRVGGDQPWLDRLGGPVRRSQARWVSSRGEPGNSLAWCRHSGSLLHSELGRDERGSPEGWGALTTCPIRGPNQDRRWRSCMPENTRRDFIKKVVVGTTALLAYPPSRILGANDRVRVAMIGAGSRGQELLQQLRQISNAELVAVADVWSRRFDEARQISPGIRTFTDYRSVLDLKDIDGIIVASPLHIHARHFLDTLAAGKDLYSEKTLTWSVSEADQCLAAAKNSNRVVQIGLQHESSGSLADARKWIKDGIVGKVTQVESWMSRNSPHGKGQWVRQVPPDCTAQNVNWKAFLNGRPDREFDPFKFINWRLYWEFSGGNVTENMVHQIAWIMTALDLPEPSAAFMSGGVFSEKDGRQVPDTIVVTLEYPTDTVVTWQSTFSNSHYGLGERLLGSDGTIEHVSGATDMVTGKSAEGLRYYPEKANRHDGTALTGETPNQNHMADWVDCVRTRKTPNASVEIGYRSAIAAHMVNTSYRRKQRVTLEMAKSFQPEF